MHLELVIAGMGGQGALTAGQLVAIAGMAHGMFVTNTPIYAPEVRGGSSNALVVVSDEPVGSMMVAEPNAAIFLCDLDVERLIPTVVPGGRVVFNASLVRPDLVRHNGPAVGVPATAIAAQVGDVRATNMVALGALTAIEPDLPIEWLTGAVPTMLGDRRQSLVDLNTRALEAGREAALAQA